MKNEIGITINDKKTKLGFLDILCEDCIKEISDLKSKKDLKKIIIYRVSIHQKDEWHLEVE